MDNIVEFKRPAPPPPEPGLVEERLPGGLVEEPLGEAYKPAHGGHPDQPAQPSVMSTVAAQVVKTLAFYALQGVDGGDLARKALRGMGYVIQQDKPGRGVLGPVEAFLQPTA